MEFMGQNKWGKKLPMHLLRFDSLPIEFKIQRTTYCAMTDFHFVGDFSWEGPSFSLKPLKMPYNYVYEYTQH
jgi:hypothetical protein